MSNLWLCSILWSFVKCCAVIPAEKDFRRWGSYEVHAAVNRGVGECCKSVHLFNFLGEKVDKFFNAERKNKNNMNAHGSRPIFKCLLMAIETFKENLHTNSKLLSLLAYHISISTILFLLKHGSRRESSQDCTKKSPFAVIGKPMYCTYNKTPSQACQQIEVPRRACATARQTRQPPMPTSMPACSAGYSM